MADAARASYRGYLSHVSRTIGLLTKAITESDVAKVRAGVTDVNNAIIKYMDSFEALSKHLADHDKSLDIVEARYTETLNLYSQVTSKADTWLNTSSPAIRDIKRMYMTHPVVPAPAPLYRTLRVSLRLCLSPRLKFLYLMVIPCFIKCFCLPLTRRWVIKLT